MSVIEHSFEVVDEYDRTWYGRIQRDQEGGHLWFAWATLYRASLTFDDDVHGRGVYMGFGSEPIKAETKVRLSILLNSKGI